MERRQSPPDRKARDYDHQWRICAGESRVSERKNRPRRRAATHRAERRAVRHALNRHDGSIDPDIATSVDVAVAEIALPYFVIWKPMKLRDHVANRKEYRAAEAGRQFFGARYDPALHRDSFRRFLEAVLADGVAPAQELARRMEQILRPRRAWRDTEFLESFLEDEPLWRDRLESWIERTLRPPAPPETER